ncbi:hypothetical protein BOX15_Mlig015951g1, partial [Macrostomum lignano]
LAYADCLKKENFLTFQKVDLEYLLLKQRQIYKKATKSFFTPMASRERDFQVVLEPEFEEILKKATNDGDLQSVDHKIEEIRDVKKRDVICRTAALHSSSADFSSPMASRERDFQVVLEPEFEEILKKATNDGDLQSVDHKIEEIRDVKKRDVIYRIAALHSSSADFSSPMASRERDFQVVLELEFKEILKKATNDGDLKSVEHMVEEIRDVKMRDDVCRTAALHASSECMHNHFSWKILQILLQRICDERLKSQCYIQVAENLCQLNDKSFHEPQDSDRSSRDQFYFDMVKTAANWQKWKLLDTLIEKSTEQLKIICCEVSAKAAADNQQWKRVRSYIEKIADNIVRARCCLELAEVAAGCSQSDVATELKALANQSAKARKSMAEDNFIEIIKILQSKSNENVKAICFHILEVYENEKLEMEKALELLKGTTTTGRQAARYAGRKGYLEVLRLVLINLSDKFEMHACGMVAAQSAAEADMFNVVKFLLDSCTDKRFKHARCLKVAEIAAERTHCEMAKYCVCAIDDPEARNDCCMRAAEKFASNREISTMWFFVESIADELKDQCCSEATEPASRNGDLETVTDLVNRIKDERRKDLCCKNAVKAASDNQKWSVVKFLAESVSSDDGKDDCYETAAERAAWSGEAEETKFFVSKIANPHRKGQSYLKSVESAASNLKFNVVKSLVQMESVTQVLRNEGCERAMKHASKDNYLNFVEFLITTVSDDRVRDKCCLTAVEHAAFNGHSRVVDYLRRSISPSAEQEFLLKAVIGSGSGGHPEVFHIVSRDFNYDLAKMAAESAAQSGKKDSMLHFLDQIKNKNGDVEECNHICARAGASFHHEHIVNYFDIQPQWLKEDKDFVDFFSKLAREGKNSILKKLLPRMSKAETHHLLTESISKGYVALALALVPFVCKQQVDLSDKDGSTALMLAADAGHHELIEKLIKHDASVNAQDSLGRTALTRACNAGHVRVAKSLIDSGRMQAIETIRV